MTTMVVGKVIRMPAMRAGLCEYPEDNERVLLSQETLAAMAPTMRGCAVVLNHQIVDSSNVEQLHVGRVADMEYNAERGEWDALFVVDDQQAVDKLNQGWGISTAYRIKDSGPGATLNNVPYQREVRGAVYDHLAIVPNPRYEMARNPMFLNSKVLSSSESAGTINPRNQSGGTMIGKILRKLMTTQEVKLNANEEAVIKVGQAEMKLADVISAVHEHEMKTNGTKVLLNGDDTVEYNGTSMTVNELVAKYNESKAFEGKETAEEEKKEEEEKKKNAEKEAEEKKNAEKEEEEKKNAEKEKEEKENSNFAALKAAKENGAAVDQSAQYQTLEERVEHGKKLFGSAS